MRSETGIAFYFIPSYCRAWHGKTPAGSLRKLILLVLGCIRIVWLLMGVFIVKVGTYKTLPEFEDKSLSNKI